MTILVLEDNKESRRALSAMLQQISDGISVEEAGSKPEAEEIIERCNDIGLFLLDINLNIREDSDVSGLDFAKSIREYPQYTFTPIVFITSYADFEITSYREAQCYSFITKPFRKSEIDKIVRKVLSQQESTDEKMITVKKDGVNYRLKVKDIIAVQAILRGVSIDMRKETMQVKYVTIKQMTEMLSEYPDFVQCHRNTIINISYVENADFVNRMIQLKGKPEPVEIGVTYKSEMKELLG